MSELIVGFPTRNRSSSRSVQFADYAEMYIVTRHDDNDDVARSDLWYNKRDYALMSRANANAVLKVRATGGVATPSSGTNHSSFDDCLVGIEHLLSRAAIVEVKTRKHRCVQAVLQEQARQVIHLSPTSSWDSIAIASICETRKAVVSARKRADNLHKEFILRPNDVI